MIYFTRKLTKKPIKKFLIPITVAVFLIASFALSPLSAQALSTSRSIDISTDLSRVYKDIGNSENGILLAEHSKGKRTSTKEKHQKGEAQKKDAEANRKFKEAKKKDKKVTKGQIKKEMKSKK
ncbi:MAG: hypothetical protein HC836_04660 [Richelia sp. RM2_1_2]|nr:hypothetical protein [Richelia sp. SM2_1_7]NJM18092.1 hypothetical protein [Richelia sp. SM1_7_0]NJN10782.1 hypothetical protein [Richelia sp. RM1_1_1]NJO26679.1 hypothetical protein [Richelia sp. SL_2_1]NJO57676.1 hypothetical protein [Richelia sp. RM2_1_2]